MSDTINNRRREFGQTAVMQIAVQSNLSQTKIQKYTGITIKTQNNWYSGYSCPKLREYNKFAADVFVNPLGACFSFLHPGFKFPITNETPDEEIRKIIESFLHVTTEQEILQLEYLVNCSTWEDLLEAFVVEAHLSMWGRILNTYNVMEMQDAAIRDGEYDLSGELPDSDIVKYAMLRGTEALGEDVHGYGMPPVYTGSEDEWLQRFGKHLAKIKGADYSNEYLAGMLGKTPATISSWLNGKSEPNMINAVEFHIACKKEPMRNLYGLIYPAACNDNAPEMSETRRSVIEYFSNCNIHIARSVTFLIFGNHGGSWHAMLQKYSVGARLPVRYQVFISNQIVLMYHLCEKTNTLKCIGEFLPDIDRINKATAKYNSWARRMIVEGQMAEQAELEKLKI